MTKTADFMTRDPPRRRTPPRDVEPADPRERIPAVRARADLVFVRQRYQGRIGWIVKNPLSLEYFRLHDEDRFLLEQLDGTRTLADIRRAFERRFAPRTIDDAELHRYLVMSHRAGLAVSDMPGQAEVLRRRGLERRRQAVRERFGNPLALRFRGVDPGETFERLYPWVRGCFTPWGVAASVVLMVAAAITLVGRIETFTAALPTFHEFFGGDNLVWLALTVAGVKVLHEFGHGLVCTHFNGRCHELGFMLLCLTPTMYCNVSDSWLLPSKWRRAAVGAAGMYVEWILAAIAVFVWRFSAPGLVHNLALNTIFVCSVSTVLVNANPLLRYDGYYILSDLLEITNLGGKASAALRRSLGRLCLGLRYDDEGDGAPPLRHRTWFVLYAVAAAVYRWFIFFGLLWFLNKYFEPYRLDIIGQALGAAAVAGVVVRPAAALVGSVSHPGRLREVKKSRLMLTLATCGALIATALAAPLPHRSFAPLEVRPRDARSVYVEVPGTLVELLVRPGERVVAGQPLARLANLDVRVEIDRLTARRDETQVVLASLRKERFEDAAAQARLTVAEQSLAAFHGLLAGRERDQERLTIRAPAAGTVLPAPSVPQPSIEDGRLPEWHGTPLDERNLGCTLAAGTLVCRIGDPQRMEAALLVDQSDVEFLAVDQTVDVRLHELPGRTWQGTIREISKSDAKVAPRSLSNKSGGDTPTRTDPAGVERPRTTSYEVRVAPLDDPDGVLRIGLAGEAKIHLGRRTAAAQIVRLFRSTFHFDW